MYVYCIRLRPSLKFVHWNQEGWKTGLCSTPPINQVNTMQIYQQQ